MIKCTKFGGKFKYVFKSNRYSHLKILLNKNHYEDGKFNCFLIKNFRNI